MFKLIKVNIDIYTVYINNFNTLFPKCYKADLAELALTEMNRPK